MEEMSNTKFWTLMVLFLIGLIGYQCYEAGYKSGLSETDQYVNTAPVVKNVEVCGDFSIYQIDKHVYIADNVGKYEIGDTIKFTK